MNEIKTLAKKFSIPIYIYYENSNGKILKTSQLEWKSKILDKIYNLFINKVPPTRIIYPKEIVRINQFKNHYKKDDFLYFGDFKFTNQTLKTYLNKCTNGKFFWGVLGCFIVHKYWRNKTAITCDQFSLEWLDNHSKEIPPLFLHNLDSNAYIFDIKKGENKKNWKAHRQKKANLIIESLIQT